MATVTLCLKWDQGSNIAQWVEATAAKSDNQNSIPGTHLVKGQKGLLKFVLCLHTSVCVLKRGHARACTRAHTIK